jgi:FAD/FMN-containing dehydrogenase
MLTRSVTSWGRVLWPSHDLVAMPNREAELPAPQSEFPTMLPFGNGRSYGDSNLNPGGTLLQTSRLNAVIDFDPHSGQLTCETGLLLSDILRRYVPEGWFPSVTPGTQFVTVGGAIANDVHGKNHHRAGTFGNHVLRFELLRSDGTRLLCSAHENPDWFSATIGGLGLTGLITWATLQLRPIANAFVECETIRFRSLEEFFEVSATSDAPADVDLAPLRAALRSPESSRVHRVPFSPPFSLVNSLTLKTFNAAYFNRQRGSHVRTLQHYRPFFYPLDTVLEWNRIYGPRGFYQYQCVVPPEHALRSVRALLAAIAASGMGSFLAVLKQFGVPASKGMLSFPMPGTTLALDFPNRGPDLHRLFDALDRIVLEAGGRLYPAKDGRMSPTMFKAGYPRWREFSAYIDRRFSSALWRRVMGDGPAQGTRS